MTPRYHFYYRFFNRSLCHVHDSIYHRWTCSPVTVRIRFGLMNLFRPKSSQGIILLSICWLTPTVSSLKEYRAKKIVSWSLLLLFVLETITDYRPFWKIVKKILCTKLYTEYLQHRRMFTWNIRHCYIKLRLFNDFLKSSFWSSTEASFGLPGAQASAKKKITPFKVAFLELMIQYSI